jgi:tellurite methyltransferase
MSGGYDQGYTRCSCFWGREPGALVRSFLATTSSLRNLSVVDLGCGEGKNAYTLARSGARVIALDCSEAAIANGRKAFQDVQIDWLVADAKEYLSSHGDKFDLVIMYGLLHCLPSEESIAEIIQLALQRTRSNGVHLVVVFNDGPHDLSAHLGLFPTLLPHDFYLGQYAGQSTEFQTNSLIHETHPHNNIPHFHSLSRLVVRKMR